MSAPIFADPILDGAADPTVVRRVGTNEWHMFYTVRRANHEGPGVQWVHGSPMVWQFQRMTARLGGIEGL